jgi:hypothetical protein
MTMVDFRDSNAYEDVDRLIHRRVSKYSSMVRRD